LRLMQMPMLIAGYGDEMPACLVYMHCLQHVDVRGINHDATLILCARWVIINHSIDIDVISSTRYTLNHPRFKGSRNDEPA